VATAVKLFCVLILAFMLAELLAMQYYFNLLNIQYLWIVIFVNLLRLQNKGHAKISGFTVI